MFNVERKRIMKNNYIQPAVEVMTINAAYSICAESTTQTFGIVTPYAENPGDNITAGQGR